jgi:hypothetical protein
VYASGDILFNGQKLTKPVKRKMGFVTQVSLATQGVRLGCNPLVLADVAVVWVDMHMTPVAQDDMLFGELTVYETLYYAARLRLPSTWSLGGWLAAPACLMGPVASGCSLLLEHVCIHGGLLLSADLKLPECFCVPKMPRWSEWRW